MYLTSNDRALCLYGGIMGAFLSSGDASTFDLSDHPWDRLEAAKAWLLRYNHLFTPFIHLAGDAAGKDHELWRLI